MKKTLNTKSLFRVAAFVALFGVAACGAPAEPADMVLHNGRVVTVDDAKPEAEAIAVKDGVILAVGSNSEIDRHIGPDTEVIDLGGQLTIPGFIEGHGHFSGIGTAKLGLELMDTESWDQIVQMVAQAVEKARPGEWIVGRGWHQEKWTSTPEPNVEGKTDSNENQSVRT